MKKKIIYICFINFYIFSIHFKYDLSLVGKLSYIDSLGRLPIIFIDSFQDSLKINFTNGGNKSDLNFINICPKISKILLDSDIGNSAVLILLEQVWYSFCRPPYEYVPDSFIKLAISMIESDNIPLQWVDILNRNFDAVIVPDDFFLEVYKNAGIRIPIFVIPLPIYLDSFLNCDMKKKVNNKFAFGMTGHFMMPWKNHELLIDAFYNEFKNEQDFVELIVHGREGDSSYLEQKIDNYKAKNIKLINKGFDKEDYLKFLKSLDCYVLISKGEGFSITPREALALGIPCILSNNTAHINICNTGYVRPVESNIKEQFYDWAYDCIHGNVYNCKIDDVQKALRDVYQNYEYYLKKANEGREWVKQYRYQNLKLKYMNIIKPKNIILEDENKVGNNYLMTNSKKLYDKYQIIAFRD